MKLFQNLTNGFREEEFLRIFSCPCSATTFEKGLSRNISVNFFQNMTSRSRGEDFQRSALKIPVGCHGNKSFSWNPILWTVFEEDLSRDIPAKFGIN